MATEVINGILKVKRGDEYVILNPRTIVGQVEGITDAVVTLFEPYTATRANFVSTNPVITKGRFAIETDKGGIKIGDGVTKWASLPYVKVDLTQIVDFSDTIDEKLAPVKKTLAEFTSEDPVIPANKFAIETDKGGIKVGDGTTKWSLLAYIGGVQSSAVIELFNPVQNTRAGFTSSNPIITKGRLAIETDKGGIKVGDGVTRWSALPYLKVDIAQIDNFNSTVNEAVAPVKMTRAEFTSQNPVIANNKLAIETDKGGIKIGDGVTNWAALSYIGGMQEETTTTDGDVLYIKTRLSDGSYVRINNSTTGDTIYIKVKQSNGTYVRVS